MRAMPSVRFPLLLLGALCVPGAVLASNCPAPNPVEPLRPMVLAPVSSELAVVDSLLGAPNGVLSQNADSAESVDQVLLRIRSQGCRDIANATPVPGVVNPDDPAAYKPRTQFDNTPWRFNMSQNGKKMTADEFSAWMKSRGVRVARGAGAAPAAAAIEPAAGTVPASTTPPLPPPPQGPPAKP
jgi:hypothetical protein